KAETLEGRVVRMIPWKEGKANHGHSCVKGRFAFDYYQHPDRITSPMIRKSVDDPWQEVDWDTAFAYAAGEFKRIQAEHGITSVGAVSSSRCTNEEIFLMQKFARVALRNNNIDNCSRICHSPTQFGLSATLGAGAASQHFDSILQSDVVLVVGANPTEGHPVFGSMLKRAVRRGARLLVIDPRRTETVDSPHCRAEVHLALRPGTNVLVLNSVAHVIVRERLYNEEFVRARCDWDDFGLWMGMVGDDRYSPEVVGPEAGLDPDDIRRLARIYASGPNSTIYYGLGVTEHSQGSTGVMCLGNLTMATGMVGREGVGVNPLRGQGNVQGGSCLGSWPHMLTGYRFVTDDAVRGSFEDEWKITLDSEPGLRLPNMFDAAVTGSFKGIYIQGEDPIQSDPNRHHVEAALRSMECVVVQDLYLSETAKLAHVFFPGSSSLEKDGTFTNAERRISRVRKVMPPRAGLADWQAVMAVCQALGYPMQYEHPSQIMDEIARTTPSFTGVSYAKLDELGSIQWPCNDKAPTGTPVMHSAGFVRGKGRFIVTEYVPTEERSTARFPLLLTTGRILSQYNVGTQTRRTANSQWHEQDLLEIHPHDAEQRGIRDGDRVRIASRTGATELRAEITDRVAPGVVYTTFHHPDTHINVVTTDFSDWATNCPEYKVTAVQVLPSNGTAAARS
ncbi:MAG: formate dehydrogenase subunit alpha, partial [Acidobacteria bacterium]|nr:formate dehydrogenase subunit alpha [Acidobacteriota bacterium]